MDSRNLPLPFDGEPDALGRRDAAARQAATDPRRNVVLEASAGTGKTTVLVNRYLNLLKAGVDPANILAITFTRKAAAEMRQRILNELQKSAAQSVADAARWRDLRDRLGDIAISTIDAFCLSLLREFPLEAGVTPGFEIADETLVAHVMERALDRALAVCHRLAAKDERLRLLIAHLGEARLRRGLDGLLNRRLAARSILRRFAAGVEPSPAQLCQRTGAAISALFEGLPGGLDAFLDDGPSLHPGFSLVARDLQHLVRWCQRSADSTADVGAFRAALDGIRSYFMTGGGEPRKRIAPAYDRTAFRSPEGGRRHTRALTSIAAGVRDAAAAFDRDLNGLLAAGVRRAFTVASCQLRRELESTGVLDFTEVLSRTLTLLGRMDEFSQSRYRLEARYHHVLVDELQDTSRAQWKLVSLLVKAWGEGAGLAGGALPPSIFVVGDRKQSIYGFRDADPVMLARARRDIAALRPQPRVRRAISRSFRSAPALLSFANDLFGAMQPGAGSARFRFGSRDVFPVDDVVRDGDEHLGVIVEDDVDACAVAVAEEISRLITRQVVVRDPRTRTPRAATPGDIAILFRSREGHQQYERALAARGIPAYVYKGLGFFDADETKDLLALVDYLGHPDSDLRAAAFLRSRFVRLSDRGLQALAPRMAAALAEDAEVALEADDLRVLEQARKGVAAWLPLVDRLPPADLVERALEQSAYAYELRGPRRVQARENLKKMRALIRRIQNRGYSTLAGLAAYLRTLSAGDESNAVIDAVDAVNLMTVHGAKGLEFPIVFLVNLCRGTGGGRDPIRALDCDGASCVSVGDFTSEADMRASERDIEETKRLLYVAVTRARDRLYFSSRVAEGRFEPKRGSLASVLPPSFAAVFTNAAGRHDTTVRWQAPSGRAHELRVPAQVATAEHAEVCRTCSPEPTSTGSPEESTTVAWQDAFEAIAADGVERVAVTQVLQDRLGLEARPQALAAAPAFGTGDDQPVLGLLVHRLFQYMTVQGVPASHEEMLLRARAIAESGSDSDQVVERAVSAVEHILDDQRVRPLLAADRRWYHEVPFSFVDGRMVLRGAIDLLVEGPDATTVVEIKTGAPRPEHELQVATYRSAAAAMFPGRTVEAVLIYVGHEPRP